MPRRLQRQKGQDRGVQVGPSRGDGVHDHDTAALLQIANALDGERLPGLHAVLVARAEQFDRRRQARVAVVGEHLDLDRIGRGQFDGDRQAGGRRRPCLRPGRTACGRGCILFAQRGHVDLDGTVPIDKRDGVIARGQDALVEQPGDGGGPCPVETAPRVRPVQRRVEVIQQRHRRCLLFPALMHKTRLMQKSPG